MKLILANLILISVLLLGVVTTSLAFTPKTSALLEGAKTEACKGVALSDTGTCDKDATKKANNLLATILNLLSLIAGALAVIMIILAGIRFITSQGEASAVAQARNAILYAVIGLVVAALSQVIVRFVLAKV